MTKKDREQNVEWCRARLRRVTMGCYLMTTMAILFVWNLATLSDYSGIQALLNVEGFVVNGMVAYACFEMRVELAELLGQVEIAAEAEAKAEKDNV